jgi:Arc/MetJ-type ribon-helix-helix transcriptional regulator
MSKQIAVRLPDELVAYIDDLVAGGSATSRAAVVARAVRQEQRRAVAARDGEILAKEGMDRDLDDLAEFASHVPMDDLD